MNDKGSPDNVVDLGERRQQRDGTQEARRQAVRDYFQAHSIPWEEKDGRITVQHLNLIGHDRKRFPDFSDVVVQGDVRCSECGLTSLKGMPQSVAGTYDCSYNELHTLEGAPETVGSFDCSHNQRIEPGGRYMGMGLASLSGGPREVKENYDCSYSALLSLAGAPVKIPGDFHCGNNRLTALRGGPAEVGGMFRCAANDLGSLEGGPAKAGEYDYGNNPIAAKIRCWLKSPRRRPSPRLTGSSDKRPRGGERFHAASPVISF